MVLGIIVFWVIFLAICAIVAGAGVAAFFLLVVFVINGAIKRAAERAQPQPTGTAPHKNRD